MLGMKLRPACVARAGHTEFLKNRTQQPVVLSSKRFDAIFSRSIMAKKHATLAAEEEDRRYMQYLKDGSDWLYSRFTNLGPANFDEERQARLDQELREGEIREKQAKLDNALIRKTRVLQANEILEQMKPSKRAVRSAVLESEAIYQRKYNEALNREIAEDGRRQQRLDDELCPETLLLVSNTTDEQIKAQEQAKAVILRAEFLKDIKERRERKLALKEQEEYEAIVERAQYRCLYEKEQKEAKERAARKREFCRQAYRDALKEKAEIRKFEEMCDKIDDRVICVDVIMRRNNDMRKNKVLKEMLAKKIHNRDYHAMKLCRMQQATDREANERRDQVVERYELEAEMEEARRQCKIRELSRQRRAYQLEERGPRELEAQRQAQFRRFEVAERYKNEETNKRFNETKLRNRNQETANLRQMLYGQRDEFLERRQAEHMRRSDCQDNNFEDDVAFFNEAVKAMQKARKTGRSVLPIAKATEIYRRKNMVPEGRMVARSKLRDYCWPGFISKADLAYKQYERREMCRQKQEKDRRGISDNCIQIRKMAAEERPYKKCVRSCPIKCFQHCGMPDVDSVDSFDCGSNVWNKDDRLLAGENTANLPKQENTQDCIGITRGSSTSKIKKLSEKRMGSHRSRSDTLRATGGADQLAKALHISSL